MTTAEKLIKIAENIPKVYEAGITAGANEERGPFWDAYQNNGAKTNYASAFQSHWDSGSFKPKYDMYPTKATNMFAYSKITGDLVEILENCGVVLDFSNCTEAWNVFTNCRYITRLGIIDMSNLIYEHREFFSYMTSLETIDKYIPPTRPITWNSWLNEVFYRCDSLKNITIGGTILETLDFKYSPLTSESAKSVITHLANYKGTENEFKYTISFSPTTWEYLDAEGNTASPNNNSWREYIEDLGWNI